MIVVTGATGTIGREVAAQLIAAGERPRLLVRNLDKAKELIGRAEVVRCDLDDVEQIRRALAGAAKAFLLTAGLEGPAQERRFIEAAKESNVRHVVKLSVMGAEYESIAFARWHRAGEKQLEASGLEWTFLRPGSFASNALWWADTIKQASAVYHPVGRGTSAVIDPADVAAVAVKALREPGHEGKSYVLSGPVAHTAQEQADVIAAVVGRPITHVDVLPADAKASMLQIGIPEAYVDALLELHAATRAGLTGAVTETVQELLGRPPGTFPAFVQRHRHAFA